MGKVALELWSIFNHGSRSFGPVRIGVGPFTYPALLVLHIGLALFHVPFLFPMLLARGSTTRGCAKGPLELRLVALGVWLMGAKRARWGSGPVARDGKETEMEEKDTQRMVICRRAKFSPHRSACSFLEASRLNCKDTTAKHQWEDTLEGNRRMIEQYRLHKETPRLIPADGQNPLRARDAWSRMKHWDTLLKGALYSASGS